MANKITCALEGLVCIAALSLAQQPRFGGRIRKASFISDEAREYTSSAAESTIFAATRVMEKKTGMHLPFSLSKHVQKHM